MLMTSIALTQENTGSLSQMSTTEIEFLFCGDTMLGREHLRVNPFASVLPIIRKADVAFCNLETALVSDGHPSLKRHVIATPAENLDQLVASGFHIVNLANNHVLDQGEAGCQQLIESLQSKGIETVGLQDSGRSRPVILSRKGIKIGFLGYADYGFRTTLMPLRERIALKDVADLRKRVGCVVVSLHWGFEYVEFPSPQQQRFAHRLIDAGAEMVIGHHPHVVQGTEQYHDGLIAYSLGNFQFRINLGDDFLNTGTGIMLRVCRPVQGRLRYEAIPIKLSGSDEVELIPVEELHSITARPGDLSGNRISRLRWTREVSRLWFPTQLESWLFRVRQFGGMQWLRMFRWLFRPENLCYLLLYLAGPKHNSSRSLFHRRSHGE